MNILFADSQGVVRHGTITIMQSVVSDMQILEAGTHHQICQYLRNENVDLLLLNTDMFGEHSISAIIKFKTLNPNVKILLLSTYTERIFAAPLMSAGADGFINARWHINRVKQAISEFLNSSSYLSTSGVEASSAHSLNWKTEAAGLVERFSQREQLVLQYLKTGTPLIKIAEFLSIKPSTVSTYKCRIYSKLGIGNQRELNDLMSMAN